MLHWALFWFCQRQQLFNNDRLISFRLKMPDFIDPSLGSYFRVLYLLYNSINSYVNVFPANIFWSSRLLEEVFKAYLEDVWKASSGRLAKTGSTRLGERKEIVTLKNSSRRVEDMSSRCFQDMSWRRLLDMSSRRFQDVLETKKMFTGRESISLSEECKSVSEKSIFNKSIPEKSKANPKQILDTLIRTQ